METANETELTFMDVFSDPVYFSTLYSHLDSDGRATLRLVCKELRDAVNLNVRGLNAEIDNEGYVYYAPINMPFFVSKLPNLERILARFSLHSGNLVSIMQGAQLARKLTSLSLRHQFEEEDMLHDVEPDIIQEAESLKNSFGAISHFNWPEFQSLFLDGMDMTSSLDAMKGLLRLSTLTEFLACYSSFNNESFSLIQPGSWPCLRTIGFGESNLGDPTVAIKALLHLTGLEVLSLHGVGITGQALSQIQPGSWPKLQDLNLHGNNFSADPMAAMDVLLHFTTLERLDLQACRLNGSSFSQIMFGDWPHLQKLIITFNHLNDNPIGAMKGLLHLAALTELGLFECKLSGQAMNHIRPGDWPHLQKLTISGRPNLMDDPVGAMKGLLHLIKLDDIHLGKLNGEVISQIKPGDWPHLQRLAMSDSVLSDNSVGAMKALLHLTALTELGLWRCELSGQSISQISPGDWPHLRSLALAGNDLSDNKEVARTGLLHLTQLDKLYIDYCGWDGEESREICTALGTKSGPF